MNTRNNQKEMRDRKRKGGEGSGKNEQKWKEQEESMEVDESSQSEDSVDYQGATNKSSSTSMQANSSQSSNTKKRKKLKGKQAQKTLAEARGWTVVKHRNPYKKVNSESDNRRQHAKAGRDDEEKKPTKENVDASLGQIEKSEVGRGCS